MLVEHFVRDEFKDLHFRRYIRFLQTTDQHIHTQEIFLLFEKASSPLANLKPNVTTHTCLVCPELYRHNPGMVYLVI